VVVEGGWRSSCRVGVLECARLGGWGEEASQESGPKAQGVGRLSKVGKNRNVSHGSERA